MAGPTRAAGVPSVASDSASGFIPEIWSGKMVEKLYLSTVFGEICNTDYEGEIKNQGDTVKIRTTPSITIRDYEIGGNLNYENPTSEKIDLNIDKAKYFAFKCNDVDAYQSDLKLMDDWSNDAGEQMKIVLDSDVLSTVYAEAAAENSGATAGAISGSYNLGATGAPVTITKADVIDYIVDCGTVLDEQNVPETDRWILLPSWMCGMLKKSDLRDASITGDSESIVRNGRVGRIDRFTVYKTNNLSTVVDGTDNVTNIIFGHKKAITWASQMTNMEDLANPNDFGRLVRGLNVYGFKVIDDNAIGHLYAKRG